MKKVLQVFRERDSFMVLEHEKPDGDCIGSGLALVLGLRALGKKARLISQDAHPPIYDFLPGRSFHTTVDEIDLAGFDPEVAVFLDCTDPERAGTALALAEGKPWLNIDHHISNSGFGDVRLVDPEASATGEIIYQILLGLGCEVSKEIATCLYVALASDTGGFRFKNTTARCLKTAFRLVDAGAEPHEVAQRIFETRSVPSLLLLGRAIATLKVLRGGTVAMVSVTRKMFEETGASASDTEGIVDYPRSVLGVEVALCFREAEDREAVHVSLRSRNRVDVAKVAVALGGGGHPAASGVLIEGSLEKAVGLVMSELERVPWTGF